MRDPFSLRQVRCKKFAPPHAPVGAKTKAVHRHANYVRIDLVVGHTTGNVRMMMLNADLSFDVIQSRRVFGR